MADGKQKADGDDRSANRKKTNTGDLDLLVDAVKAVEENDDAVEVEEENDSSDDDVFNSDEIKIKEKQKKKVTFELRVRDKESGVLPDGKDDKGAKPYRKEKGEAKSETMKRKTDEPKRKLVSSLKKKVKKDELKQMVVKEVNEHDENIKGTGGVQRGEKEKKNMKVSEKIGVRKETEKDKWWSIRSRISPHQLYLAVNKLSGKQRESVVSMGFERVLRMRTDGIPSKLAHFVVDSFNPDKMEIKLQTGSILIDENEVSNLLGLKNGGWVLSEQDVKDKEELKNKAAWEEIYSGRSITPSNISDRLEDDLNDCGMLFKYDFLVLFMNTMVEIKKDGVCELDFLKKLGDSTMIEDVNWCAHICEAIKKCKNRWQRCNSSRYFSGPLAILVLIYVDKTICGNLYKERTSSPLEFWTKERLSNRERQEIKNGGFGLVEIRDNYVENDNMNRVLEGEMNTEGRIEGGKMESGGYKEGPFKMLEYKQEHKFHKVKEDAKMTDTHEGHMDKIQDVLIALIHQKDEIKEEICRLMSLNPDDGRVKHIMGTFNVLFKDEISIGNKTTVDEKVGEMVDDNRIKESRNDKHIDEGKMEGDKKDEKKGDESKGKEKKTVTVDKTIQSFKLLSDSSQEDEVDENNVGWRDT